VNSVQLAILSSGIAVALSAVMAAAWRVQQTTGSSGWVDVSWTFGMGGVAFLAALFPLEQEAWVGWRSLAVAALAAIWSLRLGLHIVARTRSAGDDPRYRQLATQWEAEAPRRMFWFLQQQAAVGALLAISIALAAHNPNPSLRVQDVIGLLLLAAAIAGESIADSQLRRFKSASAGRTAVCDLGLWHWSRHPNYFFEWLAWLAYPTIAIDLSGHNPCGWLALLAPACMYWVLVHVSGIPPLEDHMLRTRGDVFREYQRRTRPFLPFPLLDGDRAARGN
jgi:steroid 5-alpha reductase family enzyme